MNDGHQTHHQFCRITFWKNGVACSESDSWTECAVSPHGMYRYGEQRFENTPSGIRSRDEIVSFLEKAFEAGRAAAKREIREVLGVKEPR